MISKDLTYAIVGASNNPDKFGYKVLKDLKDNGYKTIPINPKEEKILDQKTYHTLSDCIEKIEVVVFITPPQITKKVLEECVKIKINKVWFQPGSNDQNCVDFCSQNSIECIANSCIMIKKD